jgi:TPR repeat protein
MCEQGLGLPAADLEQAAAWYGHGAALQHAGSAHALAFALENGLGKQRWSGYACQLFGVACCQHVACLIM